MTTLGPPNAAKILVGTKSDLRDEMKQNGESNEDNPFVTTEMGSNEAHKYKFLSYIECSAKLFENCDQVFYEAIKAVFDIRKLSP